jgi:hypothetical protein
MSTTCDYMNSEIVKRHDQHLELNNSMAQHWNWILSLPSVTSESDVAWYIEQKRAHTCYDV